MTAATLTVRQAAAHMGVTQMVINHAILNGHLVAAKRPRATAQGVHDAYEIDAADLDRYREYRALKTPRFYWSEDMDAGLIEMFPSCTVKQLAAYFGVGHKTVERRLYLLRKQGRMSDRRPNGQSTNPFKLTRGSVLLARSCTKCGDLRDHSSYQRRADTGLWSSECRECRSRAHSDRYRRNPGKHLRLQAALQNRTAESAANSRQPWSEAEDSALTDETEKSCYALALELGRTLYAVRTRRRTLGIAKSRNGNASGIWDIDFPATQAEVEAYFRSLGGAVPEDLWDWSDEDLAVSA